MWNAFEVIQESPKTLLYEALFFDQNTKFQYPLTSLLIYKGLNAILSTTNLNEPQAFYFILKIISWLFFVLLLVFSVFIFNKSLSLTFTKSDQKGFFSRLILPMFLGMMFYSAVKADSLGQIQVLINFLFSAMLWFWINKKRLPAGFIGGLICLIKTQYAVILLWGLLRRQWRFSASFASVAVGGNLLCFTMFGIRNNLDHLKVLSFISKHGEAYYPNQSVNGLLNRLLFNGSNLNWTPHSFAPFSIWVYSGTVLSSTILLILALRTPLNKKSAGGTLNLVIITLTGTIASPVAWEHHYGILLPIFAFIFPLALSNKTAWGNTILPILAISFFLSSNYFYIAKKMAYFPVLNISQSYLLLGALILLAVLYRIRDFNSFSYVQRDIL